MVKLIGLLKRSPEYSPDEFRHYWIEQHALIARELPGLRRYVISPVVAGLEGLEPEWDGLAELWFDDRAALDRAMGSSVWGKSTLDHDFVSHRVIMLCDEVEIASS